MRTRLAITMSLGAAVCLALTATTTVPEGHHAARLVMAGDDPARLADVMLDKDFDAARAAREIEAALAARDAELARSFLDLAAARGVALSPALIEKVVRAEHDAA